jgi:hypothetical protein
MDDPDASYVDDPMLGAEMCHQGIALRGELSLDRWREFLITVAQSMDMQPTGNTMTWKYPAGGKGGLGATIVQPITESFLALDTYDNHRGAYLFVASCRPFSRSQIEPVAASFGLEYVDESSFAVLRLGR